MLPSPNIIGLKKMCTQSVVCQNKVKPQLEHEISCWQDCIFSCFEAGLLLFSWTVQAGDSCRPINIHSLLEYLIYNVTARDAVSKMGNDDSQRSLLSMMRLSLSHQKACMVHKSEFRRVKPHNYTPVWAFAQPLSALQSCPTVHFFIWECFIHFTHNHVFHQLSNYPSINYRFLSLRKELSVRQPTWFTHFAWTAFSSSSSLHTP